MTGYIVTTIEENGKPVEIRKEFNGEPDQQAQELYLVNLYPQVQYQTILGFGGAITEAVGLVLRSIPPAQAQKVIRDYYGPAGIGYTLVRTHIDSCDFSSGNYCAIQENDDTFETFSLRHDEENIIPFIKMAQQEANTTLSVMLSPWSPPAFMKTNKSRNDGGSLLTAYAPLWAKYICKYILEYRKRGISVTRLSIQNEPGATQTWDSCRYTAQQEKDFLQTHLYPALLKNGLGDVEVFIWDHNKERLFERAEQCITTETDKMISGLAFHWYSGDHFDAVRLVREKFPDKSLMCSEGCIEYSRFGKDQELKNAQMYAHDMIGNLNAGMNLFLDWNIVLDEEGGPNHVSNYCEAPVICDTQSGRIIHKMSFYYIAHFSKYIKKGAIRIATTSYSDKIEVSAFENPDHTIVVTYSMRAMKTSQLSCGFRMN
ncbi:MAG: glycoside hydrolase family 30 protein [Lachnospiraceae bacterium]